MTGKVVSIVVAPPAQIGDNRPKYLTKRGAPRRAIISRMIFAIKAIVPNSVASWTPKKRFLQLGNQDRRKRIIGKTASYRQTIKYTPLRKQQTDQSRKDQCPGNRSQRDQKQFRTNTAENIL